MSLRALLKDALYAMYERRLRGQVARGPVPRHVALIMDGNRRWAREQGYENPSVGHQYGVEHIHDALGWCEETGIGEVTIFVASTDNVRKRGSAQVAYYMELIEHVIAARIALPGNRWRMHVAGRLDDLPDSTRHALKLTEEVTRDRDTGHHLTVAIGYDGRVEIVDAVRSLLDQRVRQGATIEELATTITDDDIAAHLYTAGRPDPELVIRTSGEQRMSGFLLWQAAESELHFCDVYWPGFRKVDFLRALRAYARGRRP
ncbi:polyprenyl diphosphate synthase [Nonomuraea sp. NPDC046570]|uniref:polyprenyl diphosphate synthase n=1 Tax=Nonomuraea sp. NPDC046570 TaxID=3155255 RepID=UPI0033E51EF4